jgi:hypothetical protein
MGQAVIIFTTGNRHWLSKILHPVNHCLLCVADGGLWIVCEITAKGIDLRIEQDLPKGVYYHKIDIQSNHIGIDVFTCVNLCKKAAGVRNVFIQTPWQLLKYFRRKSK